ncbi:energy-coupling factor transporter transmembrane component T [Ruminococcus albus]|uniref:Energy-coupling factor transport system permease protein n=1 Tax=Ruminococcus albus TaxID=1264 RepID=A0A1H7ME99_RUMAL|nr:energy-coupling factor transporter transmembrane component T [Ruminococcus albus]SEL09626.1 energy-coupling factor transport system permease protein [Ruminococcus albus]
MRGIYLDPRTKLFMIFVVSLIVMSNAVTPLEWTIRILLTAIPVFLLITEGKYASALRFTAMYAVSLILMRSFISEDSKGLLSALLVGYCGIVVQFLPAMITAWYVIKTTKIGEFMSAMQKMHVPDGISVSLAVVMRFFPTIKEEYGSIRDAMKMRGISFGGGKLSGMIEYRMIPLMFSCVNIGDELSAAAVTRGLGAPIKRTSAYELRLSTRDIAVMAVFTLSACLFIGAKIIG